MKILITLFAVWLAVTPLAQAKTPGEVEIGSVLREAPMQGLSGPSRKLSEYRGKPLLINIWASWCGPCRAEMGSLDRLSRRYAKQFTVIGISTDDYPDRAKAFLQQANTDEYADRSFQKSRLRILHGILLFSLRSSHWL